MRFQVPQFIEVEDKIFGPFTLVQFIYMAGGIGISVVLFTFLPHFLAILLIIPVLGLSAALTFYKVNNKPFLNVIEAFFKYFIGSKLYVWRKLPKKVSAKSQEEKAASYAQVYVPKLSDSKLRDLTWNLGVAKEQQNPTTPPTSNQ